MKKIAIIISLSLFVLLAFRAQEDLLLPYPDYFPKPVYPFDNNPLTEAKVTLGRALFFDNILSVNNTISCAACHSNYNAFAHTDHALSHGIFDSIGTRNAPALINLAWQKTFMWDGAIRHLDIQSLAPMENKIEMGEKVQHVVQKLQSSPIYPGLFYIAWHDSTVTGEHLLKSLSAFMLTLMSARSRYDSVRLGLTRFTPQQKNGYRLFKQLCNSCHTEPLFTNFTFQNNGLPVNDQLNDHGRMQVTKKSTDSLLFKVPTLRNIEYTFPYMHDGRFKKLNEVLLHYSEGMVNSPTLSRTLRTFPKLSSNEKVDLISFLLTLSDKEFIFNAKHSFPKNILLPQAKEAK